jgi:glycosyltransferase involved in cell wall biosynthesis
MPAGCVAIVLSNLRAEGGPALAADLCAVWMEAGLRPTIILLNDDIMDMVERFRALEVPITILGIEDISPRSYPRLAWRLSRALRGTGVKALVSIPSGVHGVIFAAARLAGVEARVVHVGNYPWHWKTGFWKYRLLMRLSAPLTPHLVCVTEHVRAGVIEHFGRVAGAVHVIANGIDLDRFSVRRGTGMGAQRDPVVLMVGRLDEGKDHETLITAAQRLRERGTPVRLRIAGDGNRRGALERMVTEMELRNSVEFLGARTDIPELLDDSDVFAFSVRAEEGLGVALVEAMAAGVPVVASNVGACREVLQDGACGLLVAPANPDAFADAVERLLQDPELAVRLVVRARVRVEAVYDRRVMARRYAALCGFA